MMLPMSWPLSLQTRPAGSRAPVFLSMVARSSNVQHEERAMTNTSSKGREIKIPGPDHPITISPVEGKVRVTVACRIIAESTRALRLEEQGYPAVYYLPR